jgi:hypothetical protein
MLDVPAPAASSSKHKSVKNILLAPVLTSSCNFSQCHSAPALAPLTARSASARSQSQAPSRPLPSSMLLSLYLSLLLCCTLLTAHASRIAHDLRWALADFVIVKISKSPAGSFTGTMRAHFGRGPTGHRPIRPMASPPLVHCEDEIQSAMVGSKK